MTARRRAAALAWFVATVLLAPVALSALGLPGLPTVLSSAALASLPWLLTLDHAATDGVTGLAGLDAQAVG